MVVVSQILHFGRFQVSLTRFSFKVFRVSQRPITAYYSQFEKTIAWRLFGLCLILKGIATREKVKDCLPHAGRTTLVIKSWQNSLPFFRSCLGGARRFASFGDEALLIIKTGDN